jgi:hypothetical protein
MTTEQTLAACRPTAAELDADWTPSARSALRDSIQNTERSDPGAADRRVLAGAHGRLPRSGVRLAGIAAAAVIVAGGAAAVADATSGGSTAPHVTSTAANGQPASRGGLRTVQLDGYDLTVPAWAVPTGCLGLPGTRVGPDHTILVPRATVTDLVSEPPNYRFCTADAAGTTPAQPSGEHAVPVPGQAPLYVKDADGVRTASYPLGGVQRGLWSSVVVSATNPQAVVIQLALAMRSHRYIPGDASRH